MNNLLKACHTIKSKIIVIMIKEEEILREKGKEKEIERERERMRVKVRMSGERGGRRE